MLIYKATCLVNNKIYIGQTRKSLNTRISQHNKNVLKPVQLINRAIKKYGIENFKWEIIEKCNTFKELNEREIFWIKELDSRNPLIGYNIAVGGTGRIRYLYVDNKDTLDIINLYKDGNTLTYISKKHSISLTKIQNLLKENNIKLEKRKHSKKTLQEWSNKYTKKPTDYFTEDIILKIISLFNENYNKTEIANILNIDKKKLTYTLKKIKLKRNCTHNNIQKHNHNGMNNPNYKILTSEIIFNIKDDYTNSNLTVSDLSKKYSLGYKKIKNVLLENAVKIKKGPKL